MYFPEKKSIKIEAGDVINDVNRAHKQFKDYLNTLSVIKQMSLLSRAIQKHRGLSMSILAGYRQFRPEFDALQQQVSRRMVVLETFSTDHVSTAEFSRLQESWQTISLNWQNDPVIDNFELHSYFIEQVFELMVGLANKLELPFIGKIVQDDYLDKPPITSTPNHVFHLFSAMNFCCQQMPVFTELLAKLRGLGAFMLNKGVDDEVLKSKLGYFLQCARAQHGILYSSIEQYAKTSSNELISPAKLSMNEDKLRSLFSVLSKELEGEEAIDIDSRQLFDMASDVIDVYWQVVDQGLTLMAKWQEESLEQWFAEL